MSYRPFLIYSLLLLRQTCQIDRRTDRKARRKNKGRKEGRKEEKASYHGLFFTSDFPSLKKEAVTHPSIQTDRHAERKTEKGEIPNPRGCRVCHTQARYWQTDRQKEGPERQREKGE
mmetsp:Transcript_38794/g.76269  ORF Transcript_38794/g.76269 Transcript_38794/m.76269 type:complete len:117 (+) Transcript_38794:2740-3090(+)